MKKIFPINSITFQAAFEITLEFLIEMTVIA